MSGIGRARGGEDGTGGTARPSPSGASAGTRAAQAALAAEHAAVYGYGVVGGQLTGRRTAQAREALAAHRAHRDAMTRTVRSLGGVPVAAEPAYRLPFEVHGAEDAVRLAAHLEDGVAAAYADLAGAGRGPVRAAAARALREAAVRAVRWRGAGRAFPGMPERDGEGRR